METKSLDPVFRGSHPQLPSRWLPTSLPPLHKWKQNKNKNVAFTLCSSRVCLEVGGGCPLSSANSRGCSGLIGGGDGCEQIVSAASRTGWRSGPGLLSLFPSSLQDQKTEEGAWLGGGLPYAPCWVKAGGLEAEAGLLPTFSQGKGGFTMALIRRLDSSYPGRPTIPSRGCLSGWQTTAQL